MLQHCHLNENPISALRNSTIYEIVQVRSKDFSHPVRSIAFSVVAIAIGLAVTWTLAYNSRIEAVFGPDSNPVIVVWMACAMILFLIVALLLRITTVSWSRSMLGGALAAVTFSILIFLLFTLLELFIKGWILG